MMTSTSAPDSSPPKAELAAAQKTYRYNYSHIPPLALLDTLPPAEVFSLDWIRLIGPQVLTLLINTLAVNRGDRGQKGLQDDIRWFLLETLALQSQDLRQAILTAVFEIIPQLRPPQQPAALTQQSRWGKVLTGWQALKESRSRTDDSPTPPDLEGLIMSLLQLVGPDKAREIFWDAAALLAADRPTGRPTHIDDYQQLFHVIEPPPIAHTYQDDATFTQLRLAGPNPMMLQRISNLDSRFPVTDAQYQAVMGPQDTLAAAGSEGRLYLADYAILASAVDGTFPAAQKYLTAPLALFALPPGGAPSRQLQVVAIQCGQTPGPDNPVVTPPAPNASDAAGNRWHFAKSMVQIADGNYHEAVAHLGRTHLFVEPFIIATHRQLPHSHPLSLLLRPHFQGTLAINEAAHTVLIAPQGGVDRLLGGTIESSRLLAVKGVQSLTFKEAMLPLQLQNRGLDDLDQFPNYPYRDDALLLWDAIHQWVTDYLSLYYTTNLSIQQETQLQAWAAELCAHQGGRVRGFGESGGLQTRAYLIDAITLVIFTASVQHAAVNFPQFEAMGYAPAFPLAAYVPPTAITTITSEQDLLQMLAPLDQAQQQVNLLHLLSSVYFTRLGYYPDGHFEDPMVRSPLQRFQANLQDIEITIQQRNQTRPPYKHLLPSKIPQSINI